MIKFQSPLTLILCAATISSVSGFSMAPLMGTQRGWTARNMVGTMEAPTKTTSTTTSTTTNALDTPPPLAPLTLWGEPIDDIVAVQRKMKKMSKQNNKAPFPAKIDCIADLKLNSSDIQGQLEYVRQNAMKIKQQMQDSGAVHFTNFDLMKTQDGFQQFYKALGMHVCLDPLHSVSARPTVDGSKNSPVYEAVNKESRKNFFIGMHNEFVGTRAPRAAAFVCFKAAEEGGEFIVADGRQVFTDLDENVLKRLYERNIRYSVMELPFFGFIDQLPEFTRGPVQSVIQTLVSAAINAKVDFSVDLQWGDAETNSYDKVRMLQARAPVQPPIVRHPTTGEPTWFCNVHSHSRVLRQERELVYGAERFEDGASQINKSDMYYGDDGDLMPEDLKHMDEVTYKNMVYIKMTEGDVVLLDNYKCMHGRNVFDGTRKHGVAWFGGWEGEEQMKTTMDL